jgi:hypothetical protein
MPNPPAPSDPPRPDVTALLLAWNGGDEAALQALIPIVHDAMAARLIGR